jgi:AraC-like DNA-binding protein
MAFGNGQEQAGSTLQLSTDDIPVGDRVAAWREQYGRRILRLEVEPLSDIPFSSDLKLQMLPDLGIVFGTHSPMRVGRSRELLTDGDDGLTLQISSAAGIAAQRGREAAVGPGEAVMMSNADVGSFTFPAASEVIALRLRRAVLRPLLSDVDAAVARPVPRGTPTLRLLLRYLRVLPDRRPLVDPGLQRLVVTHIYDLLAVALGPARDAVEHAQEGGVRAALLHAVQLKIRANLHRPDLSVDEVAIHFGVTPRTVQRLFEREGTTFTDFMLGQRLSRAYQMLSDSPCTEGSITSVAFESGFNDLSYFNRTFRRRFGCTPSEVRGAPQT